MVTKKDTGTIITVAISAAIGYVIGKGHMKRHHYADIIDSPKFSDYPVRRTREDEYGQVSR